RMRGDENEAVNLGIRTWLAEGARKLHKHADHLGLQLRDGLRGRQFRCRAFCGSTIIWFDQQHEWVYTAGLGVYSRLLKRKNTKPGSLPHSEALPSHSSNRAKRRFQIEAMFI
ncbi:MAG: hypothetical protein NT154_41035, partial [Verrucomicrobia bacterium]|nr:hypothetical protein [Verrucomicrobiota bacterium]